MNLLELLRDADRKLDTGEITIGEYEKMIAPLKDAVPVVRCRDCRHWSGRKYNVHINGFLPWCRFSALQREANDFCSYGERKGGPDEH